MAFFGGFVCHVFYQRWNPSSRESPHSLSAIHNVPSPVAGTPPSYPVNFLPLPPMPAADETNPQVPLVVARDVERIRALIGKQARVRGRIFRVGHSAKSNTYFLDFGPSRDALTAVIFSSAAELFEKNKQPPKNFENKDVEIIGAIKDHPQYGLEIVLETPTQIKIVN